MVNSADNPSANDTIARVEKTDAEWRALLTPSQYYIARQKGTERAFTGTYTDHFESGEYACMACGSILFASDTKFHSGCGWPSFYEVYNKGRIKYLRDTSHGMIRTEVQCAACDAHLGHVFEDGPPPTGLRYCINSEVLKFVPSTGEK